MKSLVETTKMPEYKEWESILRNLIERIEDTDLKECREEYLQSINQELDWLLREPPHGDAYTHMHSLQILHDALEGQGHDKDQWQFLQDFIHTFLKNNPWELKKVSDEAIKNGHYEIPFGVTLISEAAFEKRTNLTTVTIPQSVTFIDDDAFYDCKNLTAVTIPQGVTSIGMNAFTNCTNLTTVTIPQSVTSIGHGAFRNCSKLTAVTIPRGVTSIDLNAFHGCKSLTTVTIPQGVTSIGSGAFKDCTSLTEVIINADNKEAYTRILKMLSPEIQKIAIAAETLKEKIKLVSHQGFFGMPKEISADIIATLVNLYGNLKVDRIDVLNAIDFEKTEAIPVKDNKNPEKGADDISRSIIGKKEHPRADAVGALSSAIVQSQSHDDLQKKIAQGLQKKRNHLSVSSSDYDTQSDTEYQSSDASNLIPKPPISETMDSCFLLACLNELSGFEKTAYSLLFILLLASIGGIVLATCGAGLIGIVATGVLIAGITGASVSGAGLLATMDYSFFSRIKDISEEQPLDSNTLYTNYFGE